MKKLGLLFLMSFFATFSLCANEEEKNDSASVTAIEKPQTGTNEENCFCGFEKTVSQEENRN